MTSGDAPAGRISDVLIAGAGLAGLTAAFGMAQAGFDVVCSGAAERTGRGRTVALLDRSVAFLDSLGVWTDVRLLAAPLRSLRLIDDTGGLFPPRPVEFHASEIGLDAFGWNIENDRMADALMAGIARAPGVERVETGVEGYEFAADAVRARLTDGRMISARLAIGADGRQFESAPRRRPGSAHPSLSAKRTDRASRPSAAAWGLFNRVPHPRRAVHARSAASQRDRAEPLEPCLGDGARRRAQATRARGRSACPGDRAPGAIAARRDAHRGRARVLPDDASDRAEDRNRTAGARRGRGACLAADRSAGAQSGLARRRSHCRLRGRSPRGKARYWRRARPCAPTSVRAAPTSRSGPPRLTGSTRRCSPALPLSISRVARALPRSRPSGLCGAS